MSVWLFQAFTENQNREGFLFLFLLLIFNIFTP